MKKVFVGMSGGVDSSVAAALLKYQGYEVIGVHLRCWNIDGCAEEDAEAARRAAETLNIPFYVFDFEKEYKERVVAYMVDGYRRGLTPNPDVMCNQVIKFGMFFDRAMELGADYVATGHYARLKNGTLYAAKDKDKDQSYFLWTLKPQQLKRCLFPIGDYIKKTEVRRLAKKFKLPNADKKDSQGICFLGHVTLESFLADFIPARRGKVLATTGKVLGSHRGAHVFTIGQRHGLGVGGLSEPHYVAAKDIRKNTVTIAPGSSRELYTSGVMLTDVNFATPSFRGKVFARVRYRQPLSAAILHKLSAKRYMLTFANPQKFIAPGQSAVWYSKSGQVLGGGVITTRKL